MSRQYTRSKNGFGFIDTEHYEKVSRVKFINKVMDIMRTDGEEMTDGQCLDTIWELCLEELVKYQQSKGEINE
tara:strand:- start:189 stop:407 length:219 start_codon:yes stop_codon:yes gene_type:complete